MTIREMIEQLQDIAKYSGDHLEVRAIVNVTADDGSGMRWTEDEALSEVRYLGGQYAEIITR